jgi:AcrR family transcriptional regulator
VTRAYDMTNRSRRARRTAERIVDATEQLLADGPIADLTLQSIADGAGVTVQTVLRHMGSRDGCVRAVGERLQERVAAQRGASEPGDVEGAIQGLMDHYEAEGRLVLNLLAQEGHGDPLVAEAVRTGRDHHRAWVQRCFGSHLSDPPRDAIDAIVAATDLYVWKLLRLDLGRSREATEVVLARLVRGILEAP